MDKTRNKLFGITYAAITAVLAAATLVEDHWGTDSATRYIYGHAWFVSLWGIFALLGLATAIRQRVWEHVPSLLMHTAVGVILLGALLSYATGQRGHIHLKKGVAVSTFDDDQQTHQMPFTMELDSFSVRYYPGTEAPMDYVSYFKVDGKSELVSMNRNYVKDGYRFCQSSFDDDNTGSWLSVNHDPYGTNTTFAGYIIFVVAGIASLFWKGGSYRKLLGDPLLKKSGLFLVALLLGGTAQKTYASTKQNDVKKIPVVAREEAQDLQRQQVIYQNRVVPFNTVATDFVKKLYGKSNYKGLMPEQVLGGWSMAPEIWRNEKMIKIKSAELRELLGIEGSYCSLSDLFDQNGKYRLQEVWDKVRHQQGGGKLGKSITETDEKVGIILMLQQNTLMKPLPTDESVAALSDTKIEAELVYNKVPFTKVLFMVNLTIGLFAFGLMLYKNIGAHDNRKWLTTVQNILPYALLASFLAHTTGYGLRWYISGRIPLNNGFETMQFLALSVMLVALLLCKRYRFVLTFGFLLSGFTLLVAYLGQMNPQITPLMPVLNSPWLSLHVSMIMMSYALFAFMLLNSIFALALGNEKRQQVTQLTLMNKLLLYPAVVLLGTGILLGAVWANESWGSYWTWDPKEVWALITLMVYGAAIAFPEAVLFTKERSFHWYIALAFLTVLMTYFGVNYLLGGMHSYANA